MSSTTSSAPAPTQSSNNNNGGNGGKPLLFFVALGFGVVFTNLWIIVGVKYCFRYNRRARALAALGQDENGDPIDLAALTRPRRRRERKLMSMEEVNERFPLTKYKVWRATREQEGLPAAGGVTAPSSRAGSVTDTMHTVDEKGEAKTRPSISAREVADSSAHIETLASVQRPSTSDRKDFATPTAVTTISEEPHPQPSTSTNSPTPETLHDIPFSSSTAPKPDDEAEDEDNPIHPAVPLTSPDSGDACAICIDNLDDDDEIRGLTCGHAFHAGCVDPWLTSRRASCPLCKADYYVPKPRADPNATGTATGNAPSGDVAPNPFGERIAPPVAAPTYAFLGRRAFAARQRTYIMGGRFATVTMDEQGTYDWRNMNYASGGAMPGLSRRRQSEIMAQQQQQQQQQQQTGGGRSGGSRLWSFFSRGGDAPRRPGRGEGGAGSGAGVGAGATAEGGDGSGSGNATTAQHQQNEQLEWGGGRRTREREAGQGYRAESAMEAGLLPVTVNARL